MGSCQRGRVPSEEASKRVAFFLFYQQVARLGPGFSACSAGIADTATEWDCQSLPCLAVFAPSSSGV
jgi:hypothetical protein